MTVSKWLGLCSSAMVREKTQFRKQKNIPFLLLPVLPLAHTLLSSQMRKKKKKKKNSTTFDTAIHKQTTAHGHAKLMIIRAWCRV